MTFNTYDILFVEIKAESNGSVQTGCRPVVLCDNGAACLYSPTIIVMPLTTSLKKLDLPTHEVIEAKEENGLRSDSMILGEQVFTINKNSVIKKLGHIYNEEDQSKVCKCYLANLFGKKKIKVVEEF